MLYSGSDLFNRLLVSSKVAVVIKYPLNKPVDEPNVILVNAKNSIIASISQLRIYVSKLTNAYS